MNFKDPAKLQSERAWTCTLEQVPKGQQNFFFICRIDDDLSLCIYEDTVIRSSILINHSRQEQTIHKIQENVTNTQSVTEM